MRYFLVGKIIKYKLSLRVKEKIEVVLSDWVIPFLHPKWVIKVNSFKGKLQQIYSMNF